MQERIERQPAVIQPGDAVLLQEAEYQRLTFLKRKAGPSADGMPSNSLRGRGGHDASSRGGRRGTLMLL